MFRKKRVLLLTFLFWITNAIHFSAFALPSEPEASSMSDLDKHWAQKEIVKYVEEGFINGYGNNSFQPDNYIKRSEFIKIVNSLFGFSQKDKIAFKDVKEGDWYYDEVAKASRIGYVKGSSDGNFNPDKFITRQEAAAIIARIHEIEENLSEGSLKFSDRDDISGWALNYIKAVADDGYMKGYNDNTFKPLSNISRAEAVVLISRIAGSVFNAPGNYGKDEPVQTVDGNVTVGCTGVSLSNLHIKGNLYLTEGIGDGEVSLENITVDGETIIKGGGPNSIVIINSNLNVVMVNTKTETVRLLAKGKTNVNDVVLLSSAKLEEEEISGDGFGKCQVRVPEDEEVVFIGEFGNVEIDLPNIKLSLASGNIQNLTISEQAKNSNVKVDKDATIAKANINAKTNISGTGSIKKAQINSDNVKIEQKIDDINLNKDVDKAIVGGKTYTGDEAAGSSSGGSGGSSSGGSGGGSTPTDSNTAPIATNDTTNVDEDGTVLIDVLSNDTDADSDTLSVSGFGQGGNGTVSQEGDSLRYAPDADFNGSDSFTYDISDGKGGSDTGTVTVTVNAINDNPTVATPIPDQSGTVGEAFSYGFDESIFDDLDGDSLVYSAAPLPDGITFTAGTRTFSGTPTAEGLTSVVVTASDGNGGSVTDTFNIVIEAAPNNAPTVATGQETQTGNATPASNDGTTTAVSYTADASGWFSDADSDTLTYAVVSAQDESTSDVNSDVTINTATGALTYVPDAAQAGQTVTIVVKANDGTADSTANVTVTVAVGAVPADANNAPAAINDTASVDEDGTVLIDVLSNDTDADSDTLSVSGFGQGGNGTVSQEGDSLRYAPDADFNGSDSFTYDISDGKGGSDTGTVTVTVNAINDNPTVATPIPDQSGTVGEAFSYGFDESIFDDLDGDSLVYSAAPLPDGITFTAGTRTFSGTPTAEGLTSVVVTASDGNGGSVTDTFNIVIEAAPNNAPTVATGQETQTGNATPASNDGTTTAVSYTADVSGWFSDADSDTLTYAVVSAQDESTSDVNSDVTINTATGALTYVPDAAQAGQTVTIVVKANDGTVDSTANVTVTVAVGAVPADANNAPAATNDTTSVDEDGTVLIDVLSNDTDADSDTLSVSGFGQGGNGTVSQEGSSLRYAPDADFNGSDSFTYDISDGKGGSDTGTVTVTVNAINDNPTVATPIPDQSGTVGEAFSYGFDESIFDDLDGDSLVYSAAPLPDGITFTAGTRTFSGTPTAEGLTSVVVTASDGNGGSVTDTFNIVIEAAPNNAPTVATGQETQTGNATPASNDGTTTAVSYTADASGWFSDADSDTLIYAVVSAQDESTSDVNSDVTINTATGALTYVPDAAQAGQTVTIVVKANDGTADSTANVTVTVAVGAVPADANNAPAAINDTANVDEDGTVLIDVLSNDTDADSDTLSVSGFGQGGNGTVSQEGSSLRYAPDANFNGSDSFTYDISDGKGGSDTGTVTVTVNAINDNPTVATPIPDQSGTVGEAFSYGFDESIFDDLDGDSLVYSAAPLPDGITFTAGTRTFSGTPTAEGLTSVVVTASDGNGGSVTDTFNIVIEAAPNNAPTVATGQETQTGNATPASNDGTTTAVSYTADVSGWFSDADSDTLTYAVVLAQDESTSDVNSDVTINTATGALTYVPDAAQAGQTVTIVVKANDGTADSTANVTVTVAVGAVPADAGATGDICDAATGSDFTGTVYVRDGKVYYNEYDSSSWGVEELVGAGDSARLAIDSLDNPHIVYATAGKIGYRMHDGSSWTTEVLIASNNGGTCSKPDIAVDGNGVAHITYTDTDGNTFWYTNKPDIMYATNSSGTFTNSVVFDGYYENLGGSDYMGEYFNKGSRIAVDANGNYFIMTHSYSYYRSTYTDRTYSVSVKSNLGTGTTTTSTSDIFDLYDLTANGDKVVALYKQTGFRTSELTVADSNINFVNIRSLAAGSYASSVATDGTNTVVGGISSSYMQTHYNGISTIYNESGSEINVNGTIVSIVNRNGIFYAVYTDNSDGKIKVTEVEEIANPTVINAESSETVPNSLEATSDKDGTLYLVDKNEAGEYNGYATVSDLDSAVLDGCGRTAACTANVQASIPTDEMQTGTYVVYAVDQFNLISSPSSDITITNPDTIAPILSEVRAKEGDYTILSVTSTENGSLFMVDKSQAVNYNNYATEDDLLSAVDAGYGLEAGPVVANQAFESGVSAAADGTYLVYAQDAAGNLSLPSEDVVISSGTADLLPTAAATLSGTEQVGDTLTAASGYYDADGDAEAGTTYAFYRYDADGVSNETEVQAASTTNSYTLVSADEGKVIKVKVVPVNSRGTGVEVVSEATGVIAAEGTHDTSSPTVTFNIADGEIGVSVHQQIVITFDEPVRKLDDSELTDADLASDNEIVSVIAMEDTPIEIAYTATVNAEKTSITLNPDDGGMEQLLENADYMIAVNNLEDASDNAISETTCTFRTENPSMLCSDSEYSVNTSTFAPGDLIYIRIDGIDILESTITVTAKSEADTDGIIISIDKDAEDWFKGSFQVVGIASDSGAVPPCLLVDVNNGDTVTVEYGTTVATASITAASSEEITAPVISDVALYAGAVNKVGAVMSVTVVADASGYTAEEVLVNEVDVTDTFVDNGDSTYQFTYTVAEGDTDRSSEEDIPVSVVLSNNGTVNAPYTEVPTYTFSASPSIEANTPAEATIPVLVSLTPADNAVVPTSITSMTAEFDQAVTAVDLSGITIECPVWHDSVGNVAASFTDSVTLSITHDSLAHSGNEYIITIPAGAVKNTQDMANQEITWSLRAAPVITPRFASFSNMDSSATITISELYDEDGNDELSNFIADDGTAFVMKVRDGYEGDIQNVTLAKSGADIEITNLSAITNVQNEFDLAIYRDSDGYEWDVNLTVTTDPVIGLDTTTFSASAGGGSFIVETLFDNRNEDVQSDLVIDDGTDFSYDFTDGGNSSCATVMNTGSSSTITISEFSGVEGTYYLTITRNSDGVQWIQEITVTE